MSSSLKRELKTAREVAVEAGKILLAYYDTNYQVQMKPGDEPVTIADKSSSNFIIEALQRQFPQDAIVSEESALPTGLSRESRIWVVDPMDGTKEFIKHNGEFSVMIGLVREGEPVMGVVYQPVTGMMYWGSQAEGSFMLEPGKTLQRMQVSAEASLENLYIAASRSNLKPEMQELYNELGFRHILQAGSLGLKCALIARQICHIYLNLSNLTSAWDTCAPEVILKEAGGRISNLFGYRLTYTFSHVRNRKGVLATNGPIHDYLVEQIQMLLTQRTQEELSV